MNYKAFFTIILSNIIILASCGKMETFDKQFEDEFDFADASTKVENCEYAYVRLGVYETIEGHSVTITNMRIEGRKQMVVLPEFGTNITDSESISSDSEAPTFDMENGDYTGVVVSGTSTEITIHFDALVCREDIDFAIPVTDAKIRISASDSNWENGNFYSYELCIDAKTLGLKEIGFNPTVSDYEDVNV
ncbi:MAG: hypothetical protein ACI3ZN_10945 [Candidatus Cryptobacteroides sp.]